MQCCWIRKFLRFAASAALVCPIMASSLNAAESGEKQLITLEEAKDLALSENWSVQLSNESIKEAKARRDKAFSVVLPNVEARATYNWFNDHHIYHMDDNRGYSLDINQLLFSKEAFEQIAASGLALDGQRLLSKEEANTAVFMAVEAYRKAQAASNIVEAVRDTLALAVEYRDAIEARYSNGEASDYDRLRAGVEVRQLEYRLESAIAARDAAIDYLKFLLGKEKDFEIEPIADNVMPKEIPLGKDALIKLAQQHRPLLKGLSLLKDAAGAMIEAAKGKFLPAVGFSYSINANKKEPFAVGRKEYDSYNTATLYVSLPIFEGGRRAADVKEAESQFNAAKIRLEQSIASTEMELSSALSRYKAALAKESAAKSNLDATKRLYEITEKRFANGQASQLDVLDARNSLMSSKVDYMNALADVYIYQAQIAHIVGLDEEALFSTFNKEER